MLSFATTKLSMPVMDKSTHGQLISISTFTTWRFTTQAKWFNITCQTSYQIMESTGRCSESQGEKKKTEGRVNGDREKGDIVYTVGQAHRGAGKPHRRGNRCSCAAIRLGALDALWWIMWTEGSPEVHPTLN